MIGRDRCNESCYVSAVRVHRVDANVSEVDQVVYWVNNDFANLSTCT